MSLPIPYTHFQNESVLTFSQRYKDLGNRFRTDWQINCIPALVRYERQDGQVNEAGRLVEGELLDETKIQSLIK